MERSREVLDALRDVTENEAIARAFEGDIGFRASLLRFSEAERIYRVKPLRLHRDAPATKDLFIRFHTQLKGFDSPHDIELTFSPEPLKLGRIHALVGKNGTGKTNLLARLAMSLWGLAQEDRGELIEVHGLRPGRVIAVTFSALDAFDRPPHRAPGVETHPAFDNYRYCGLRGIHRETARRVPIHVTRDGSTEVIFRTFVRRWSTSSHENDGPIDVELVFKRLSEDLEEVRRLGRMTLWKKMIEEIRLLPALGGGEPLAAARRLGAGHKVTLSVLTRVLASMRNGSIVLYDEPEINMHPTLLAAVLRTLHEWLEAFDGYGVVATHSPIVLQEIPARNVIVLDHDGDTPIVQRYRDVAQADCFGQSLSEIVGDVFGVDERDKNYLAAFRALLDRGGSEEQIEEVFEHKLSLGARVALRALAKRGKGDHA